MVFKKCKECGVEYPATEEYFSKLKVSKDKLNYFCKKCNSIKCKTHYSKNKEKAREYYKNHVDEIRERDKNKKQQKIEYLKNYYKNNSEKLKERARTYRKNNIEWKKLYDKTYGQNNKEKINIISQRRRAKEKNLSRELTYNQWEEIKKYFNYKCAYCGKADDSLQQEHFVPVYKNGEYSANNIIPSCKTCNASKGVKEFNEWYPSYKHYSKRRENKILKYLGYKNNIQQLKLFIA